MRRRRNPEIVAGRVNADGSIAAGDGFTVQHPSAGNYIITITAPGFKLISAVLTQGGTYTGAQIYNFSERAFYVATGNGGADWAYAFIAVGVQQ